MVNRALTLTEDGNGNPLLPTYTEGRISKQEGTPFYIVYLPFKSLRAEHSIIMWKQSPGTYAVFCSQDVATRIGAGARNLVAECVRPTHAWRTWLIDGTDSAINPQTGQPYGAFVGRPYTSSIQPVLPINSGKPWVVGNLTITRLVPAVGSTLGPVDLVASVVDPADPPDDAISLTQIVNGEDNVENDGLPIVIGE